MASIEILFDHNTDPFIAYTSLEELEEMQKWNPQCIVIGDEKFGVTMSACLARQLQLASSLTKGHVAPL